MKRRDFLSIAAACGAAFGMAGTASAQTTWNLPAPTPTRTSTPRT